MIMILTRAGRMSQSSGPHFARWAFRVAKRAATTAAQTGGQIVPAVQRSGGWIFRDAIVGLDWSLRVRAV